MKRTNQYWHDLYVLYGYTPPRPGFKVGRAKRVESNSKLVPGRVAQARGGRGAPFRGVVQGGRVSPR